MAIQILLRLDQYNAALEHTDFGKRSQIHRFHPIHSIRTELRTILKDSASMGAIPAMSLAEVFDCCIALHHLDCLLLLSGAASFHA